MIDFTFPDEVRLASETARRFADEVLRPGERAHEAARGIPAAVRAQACSIGLDRIAWPEDAGGAGLGALARVVTLEALATGDAAAALALDSMGQVAPALLAFGGVETLRRHANTLDALEGARAALVVDLDNNLQGTDGRLHGSVPWLPVDRVDLLAVLTRTGLTLLHGSPMLTQVPGSGLRAAGASRLVLTEATVLERWSDPAAAAKTLAHARLEAAALMLGQMQQAAEYARHYALERSAFGKPIAHHQALAFLIVELRMAVDGARCLLHEAAWRLDTGLPAISAAASAYLEAVEAGRLIGPAGVQILGAAGFMQDHPQEKAMRELRTLSQLAGGVDAARDDAWTDDPADDPLRPIRLLAPAACLA